MKKHDIDIWLNQDLPIYDGLTKSVVTIVSSLMKSNNVDVLSIEGRTKTKESIFEKIKRKSYRNPKEQLTDISGIRIILYFESNLEMVGKIIEDAFRVDKVNSLDKKDLLEINQLGYRSVHYVCDLGDARCKLPEFKAYKGLKFEFQVRTVLQHAWAELAHDRNYKFSGRLPKEIERKLYLYAGLLEVADQGFDEVSKQIDEYIEQVQAKTEQRDYDVEVNSITLDQFIKQWTSENKYELMRLPGKNELLTIAEELSCFGIRKISDLHKIIPPRYVRVANELHVENNLFGLLRDWMLIKDYKRYRKQCWKEQWRGLEDAIPLYIKLLGKEVAGEIVSIFGDEDDRELLDA